jgi:hypothetical protein
LASFDDYPGFAALASAYDLEVKSEQEWRSLWLANPAFVEFAADWPLGWVLELPGGQIAGYLGNIPLAYELGGRRVMAANSYCWVVDVNHRAYSLLLLEHFFRQKKPELFLGTSVSRGALDAYRAFETSPVPVGRWDESIFWITNHNGFARSLLASKQVRAGPLSLGLAAALACRDLPGRIAATRQPADEVACSRRFEERFDDFWRELGLRHPCRLMAVRTRELLEWHFKFALLERGAWIESVRQDRTLAAYAIFVRQDSPKFGLKRVRLADFQTLGGDSLLAPLLAKALRRCREQGIHMLECIGVHLNNESVRRMRPLHRKLPSWMYYYRANRPELATALADPAAWAPSTYDGDSSL